MECMFSERDCGNGVMSDLLSNTFQQCVCSINSNSLNFDKSNGDEAKNYHGYIMHNMLEYY